MTEAELWKWLFIDDELTRRYVHLRERGASPSEAFFYKKYPLSFVPHPKDFSMDDPIVQRLKSEDFYRLSCVLKGRALISSGSKSQELFAGDCVIDKVSSSQGVITNGHGTVMLNCMFRREFIDPCSLGRIGNTVLSNYFEIPHGNDAHLVLHGNHNAVKRLLMNATKAYLQDESTSYPESAFYTLLLITELAKNEVFLYGEDQADESAAFISRLRKTIFDHIRDVDLDLIAREYGYSKAYFSDMISRRTGIKYTEHVREVRIAFARNLLETTDMPIEQIAYLCGYANTSRFFQVFKCDMGMTPGEYRASSPHSQASLRKTASLTI